MTAVLQVFVGVGRQATLPGASIFFTKMRKIAFAETACDRARKRRVAIAIGRTPIITRRVFFQTDADHSSGHRFIPLIGD